MRTGRVMLRWLWLLAVGSMVSGVAEAATPDLPIVPGLAAIGFVTTPVVRASFARNEPFLEGDLTYAYGGVLTSDVTAGGAFGMKPNVLIKAGSYAYGVPMVGASRKPFLVWCAVERLPDKSDWRSACLVNQIVLPGGRPIFRETALIIVGQGMVYHGGDIEPAPFNVGVPIHIRYFVQNLGQIVRVKGEITPGTDRTQTWGEQWGTIVRTKVAGPTLLAVAGGLISLEPDPEQRDHYLCKVLAPLRAGGTAAIGEARPTSP